MGLLGPEPRPRSSRATRVGMVGRKVDERGHVLQRVHKCGMHCLKWPDTTRTVERGWITERKHWFVRRRTRTQNISLSPDGAPAVTCSHVDFSSKAEMLCVPNGITFLPALPPSSLHISILQYLSSCNLKHGRPYYTKTRLSKQVLCMYLGLPSYSSRRAWCQSIFPFHTHFFFTRGDPAR
jgi:hypothetical protein